MTPPSLLERLTHLPRHPFKLARELVRGDPSEPQPPLILLACDNDDTRALLLEILEILDYRVIISTNSEDFVDLCAHKAIDLIIAGISPRGETGEAIIDRVRQVPNCRGVPVILIITFLAPGQSRTLRQSGAFSVMSSPIDIKELITTVQNALHSPRGQTQ